jgi:hypothetical protein
MNMITAEEARKLANITRPIDIIYGLIKEAAQQYHGSIETKEWVSSGTVDELNKKGFQVQKSQNLQVTYIHWE